MRRLLTFLLIVSGFAAFGQQQQYLGAPNTTVINRGHLRTDSTFQNAIRDTTFTPVRLGIQVYRPADNSLYYSISTTTRPYWAKVGSGAGSTGGVDSIVRIVDTLFIYTRDTVISVYTPCQDTEGGIVTWTGTGFNFAVSAWPFYCINGVQYSYGGGQVTLDAADPDNPRYDAIVIDTNGTAVVITGTPAAAPAQPQYDHSSQRLRTYIFVPAAATEPYNVSSALIYNENVEWTITTGGTISINANNATNVFTGSKSLRLASWGNNARVSFTTPDPLNHPDYTVLTFWMNLSAEFSTRQNIFVQFYNSTGTMVSDVQQVLFDKKKTGYQAITIPLSQFQFYSGQISEVRFTFTGTNSSPVYLDYIQLQGGIQLPPGSGGGTPYSLSLTDGTTTVPVLTGSAIKFQSDNSRATFNVSGNPPTVLLTVNGFSLPVDSIQGLADSLGNRITDVFKANDTLWKVVGGDTLMIDTTELVYYHPGQFRKSGTSPEDALELFATPSAAAPDSVLRLAPDGTLYQHPAPSGGGGSGTVNTGIANRLAYYDAAAAIVKPYSAITSNRALHSDANGLPVPSATTDTELGYLSGATSNVQTQINGNQSLTDGATVTFDASLGKSARVTLGGNRTLSITNFNNGEFLSLLIIQDGTGSRTLTLPASTRVINGGAGAVTLSTAAGTHDILTFWKINNIVYCNYGKNYN